MMYDVLGYPPDHPDRAIARASIDKLLVVKDDEAYCQPCVSPVWDTALACHALLEAGDADGDGARADRGLDWLEPLQVLDVKGDWSERRPDVRPGGWAFQYANAHYPDLDDTAVVVMAMDRAQRRAATQAFDAADRCAAREWIVGLQSQNGGWGAFDADNNYHYLNNIPFADHGALLDPPTEDVTGALRLDAGAARRDAGDRRPMRRGARLSAPRRSSRRQLVRPLGHELHLRHLVGAVRAQRRRRDRDDPMMRKAADWLVAIQNADGGWGEDGASYKLDYRGYEPAPSTASQTAWALLGLMAAGEVEHPAVARGIAYLPQTQAPTGSGTKSATPRRVSRGCSICATTAIRRFFPLWAMARYRNLKSGNSRVVSFGM